MFNIIVAHSINKGIGYNNKIPWNISDDLKYFQRITTNSPLNKKNAIIIGKNTWYSLVNKPLKNRYNYVLTTKDIMYNANNNFDNVIYDKYTNVNTLLSKLEKNNDIDNIFV